MQITTTSLVRWTGLAAMGAGIIFAGIQPIHPLDVLSSVTTPQWAIIQTLKTIMSFLGLIGLAGLYDRQVKEAGWLGLAGYLVFSIFWAFTSALAYVEAFVLPMLATVAPQYVEGFLGVFNGHPTDFNMGAVPVLYSIAGAGYVLGGVLFGIATFRAGVLPRWGAALLAVAGVAPFVLASLPHPLDRSFAVPMGIALVWLGWALWSDRREHATELAPVMGVPHLRPTAAK